MISNVGVTPFPASPGAISLPKPDAERKGTELQVTAASAQRSVDGQLQLTTREGDSVTISAHADASVTYASLRGRSAEGRFASRYTSLETHAELSIQVQGDLSEQELADIQKVVKSFFHELRQAFRGHTQGESAVVNDGNSPSTLAGFSVNIESSQSVSVVSVFARPLPAPVPVAPATGDGTDDAAAQLVGDTDPAGSAAAPASPPPGDLTSIVARLLAAVRQSSLPAHKLDRVLDHVFKQFGRQLESSAARDVLEKLRLGVQQGIVREAPAESSPVDVPAAPLPSA